MEGIAGNNTCNFSACGNKNGMTMLLINVNSGFNRSWYSSGAKYVKIVSVFVRTMVERKKGLASC